MKSILPALLFASLIAVPVSLSAAEVERVGKR